MQQVTLIAHSVLVNNIPGYIPHGESSRPSDLDDLGEQGGRLCYLSWNRPHVKTSTNKGYLDNIIKQGHYSVLEHATATFFFEGVTRNFTHEMIRHRHFSYSEVSQRYVDVGTFEFAVHPGLHDIDLSTWAKLSRATTFAREAYETIVEDLTRKGRERKQARQAARHALQGGTETKILVTGNLRAWREMVGKRLSPHADEEFQDIAVQVLRQLIQIAPNSFQDFTS